MLERSVATNKNYKNGSSALAMIFIFLLPFFDFEKMMSIFRDKNFDNFWYLQK